MRTLFLFFYKSRQPHRGFYTSHEPLNVLLDHLKNGTIVNNKNYNFTNHFVINYAFYESDEYETLEWGDFKKLNKVYNHETMTPITSIFDDKKCFISKHYNFKDNQWYINVYDLEQEDKIDHQLKIIHQSLRSTSFDREKHIVFMSPCKIIEFSRLELNNCSAHLMMNDILVDDELFLKTIEDSKIFSSSGKIINSNIPHYLKYRFIMRLCDELNDFKISKNNSVVKKRLALLKKTN